MFINKKIFFLLSIFLLIILVNLVIFFAFFQNQSTTSTSSKSIKAKITPTVYQTPYTTEVTPIDLPIRPLNNIVSDKTVNLNDDQKMLAEFLNAFGLKYYYQSTTKSDYFSYTDFAQNDPNLAPYAKTFIGEWNKYSIYFVTQTKIQGIYFVNNLNVSGQRRAAMPESYNHVLYLDISYIYDPDYVREVIHHEFYHLIEYQFHGDFYYQDPAWMIFNPKSFKYLSSGSDAYTDPNYIVKDHPKQGFVSTYSTYALEEDKAETFGYMMTTKKAKLLQEWIKTDPYLKKKYDYMVQFMTSISDDANINFFNNIANR